MIYKINVGEIRFIKAFNWRGDDAVVKRINDILIIARNSIGLRE